MSFCATGDGIFTGPGILARCALGRAGVAPAHAKREGDGASPAGAWPLRAARYRPDRCARPQTALPCRPIAQADGWCDAPGDPLYNKPVSLPYRASAEALWRTDGLYDLLIVLGYNDAPVQAGLGSCIFLHLAAPDFTPTAGCVAVDAATMIAILAAAQPGHSLEIAPG